MREKSPYALDIMIEGKRTSVREDREREREREKSTKLAYLA